MGLWQRGRTPPRVAERPTSASPERVEQRLRFSQVTRNDAGSAGLVPGIDAHGQMLPRATIGLAGISPQAGLTSAMAARTGRISMTRSLGLAVAAASFLLLGGCVSQSDIDNLSSQVASLRAQVQTADAKATQVQMQLAKAQVDAAAALQQSQAVSQRVDRLYEEPVRR